MKKAKYICLVVLGVLFIAIIFLGIWQKDNIVSFVNSYRYSEEELAGKLDNNAKKMQKLADDTEYISIRGALSEEEEEALRNNEITVEQAIKLVRGQTDLEQIRESGQAASQGEGSESTANASTSEVKQEPAPADKAPEKNENKVEDRASDIVAELYVVKSEFISKLKELGNQAYSDFCAKGKDKSLLPYLVESYTPAAGDLETQCDKRVNELLSELNTELKNGGYDTSLVNEIRQYYYNEKSLTKSYYLNKYLN